MFFKVVGVIAIVFVVGVGIAFLYIRRKWRQLVRAVGESVETPSEIHLTEDINPDWYGESEIVEIQASGFRIGRAYVVQEMEGVQVLSFFHETGIVGALYCHPLAGTWYDLVAVTPEQEITVGSAPAGGELDTRPECRKVFMPNAALEGLLEEMRKLIAGAELKRIDDESFRDEFEGAYRKDMAWRNRRGGITEEEVNRIAANMDEGFDEDVISEGFIEAKTRELYQWHDEAMKEFRKTAPYNSSLDDQYFIVSPSIHKNVFVDYLSEFFVLNDKQISDFNELAETDITVLELFDRITGCLSPVMQPTSVGQVSHPIEAQVFLANM